MMEIKSIALMDSPLRILITLGKKGTKQILLTVPGKTLWGNFFLPIKKMWMGRNMGKTQKGNSNQA